MMYITILKKNNIVSLLFLLALSVSAAVAGAAAIDVTVSPASENIFEYSFQLTNSSDSTATIDKWYLPIVSEPETAITIDDIVAPKYWDISFQDFSQTTWSYQNNTDSNMQQFNTPYQIISFTFDEQQRQLRETAINNTLPQSYIKYQTTMSSYQNLLETYSNLRQPIHPLLQQEYQNQFDQYEQELAAQLLQIQRLNDELEYLTANVDGINPGYQANFTITAALYPGQGPVAIFNGSDENYLHTQVPVSVPEPLSFSLMLSAGIILTRRQ